MLVIAFLLSVLRFRTLKFKIMCNFTHFVFIQEKGIKASGFWEINFGFVFLCVD